VSNATDIEERLRHKFADLLTELRAESRRQQDAELKEISVQAQAARDRAARIIQDARRRNDELDAASQEQAAG
jgi:hypothetical protein